MSQFDEKDEERSGEEEVSLSRAASELVDEVRVALSRGSLQATDRQKRQILGRVLATLDDQTASNYFGEVVEPVKGTRQA